MILSKNFMLWLRGLYPFPTHSISKGLFSLWSRKAYTNFGMLGFKILPELISAILNIYVTLTTPTN